MRYTRCNGRRHDQVVTRRGLAARDLLLIGVFSAAAIGYVVDGLRRNKQAASQVSSPRIIHSSTPEEPAWTEIRSNCVTPLGEEFLCLMELRKIEKPDPLSEPYYLTRLRIGRRRVESPDSFILEIRSTELESQEDPATCEIFSVQSADAEEANLHAHLEAQITAATRGEVIFYNGSTPKSVGNLEDALRLLLPETLQDTGHLLLTSQLNLEDLRDVQDYPLDRLAFAIRDAAEEHDWDTIEIAAVLHQSETVDPSLTQDEVSTLR